MIVGIEQDGKVEKENNLSINKSTIELAFFNAKIPVVKIRKSRKGGFIVHLYSDTKFHIKSNEDLKRVIAEMKILAPIRERKKL